MRILIVAAAAALAAGCFGGLKSEVAAPLIYRVNAPQLDTGPAIPADLSIAVVQTAPGLEGDRIAVRSPGNRLDHVAGARWAGDLAPMLESALVQGFQDSGRLRSVQGDTGRFRATHTLVIEVRRFEADYTAGGVPVAQVALAVTLGSNADRRKVLASFTASASESALENRQTSMVAALDAAFARATAEMAGKTFDAIAVDANQASANIGP